MAAPTIANTDYYLVNLKDAVAGLSSLSGCSPCSICEPCVTGYPVVRCEHNTVPIYYSYVDSDTSLGSRAQIDKTDLGPYIIGTPSTDVVDFEIAQHFNEAFDVWQNLINNTWRYCGHENSLSGEFVPAHCYAQKISLTTGLSGAGAFGEILNMDSQLPQSPNETFAP